MTAIIGLNPQTTVIISYRISNIVITFLLHSDMFVVFIIIKTTQEVNATTNVKPLLKISKAAHNIYRQRLIGKLFDFVFSG